MTQLGNENYEFVRTGNLLASRSVLLLILAVCRGSRFILEQPANTIVSLHPRWNWLRNLITDTFLVGIIELVETQRTR
jgi:hypothetical protein